MTPVRVEPSGIELEVAPGRTIFEAAADAGYSWPTVCGGKGSCRTCFTVVLEGVENLSPIEAWEREGLEALAVPATAESTTRLACQARPTGPVVVRKHGVRLID